MSNSPPSDNSSWKKLKKKADDAKRNSIDVLICKVCKHYVKVYLSKNDADKLGYAYKASKFDEVKKILKETLKQIKIKKNNSENQKAEQTQLLIAYKTIKFAIDVVSNKVNSIKYTEKDKDMMKLIHELSIIYDNTDQYLKGQVPQQKI